MTLRGKPGDDAWPYQEKQVRRAIEDGPIVKPGDRYHKWGEWCEEDQAYLGKCPDLITGIHGDDPIRVYRALCEVVEEVIQHFESEGRVLPRARVRPMQEVP